MRSLVPVALLMSALAVGGCATAPPAAGEAGASARVAAPDGAASHAFPFEPPPALRWFRTSAERQASFAQAYRLATSLVEARRPSGAWVVVMDADETILDNSEVEDRIARLSPAPDLPRVLAMWEAWAFEERAPVFAPARDFIARVNALGGRVVVVTNRPEPQCVATRRNLEKAGAAVAAVLCAPLDAKGEPLTDKTPRFDAAASGGSTGEAGPVTVLLHVGDNIKDCRGETQAAFHPERYGVDCIVLPNPMYGSWDRNPYPPPREARGR